MPWWWHDNEALGGISKAIGSYVGKFKLSGTLDEENALCMNEQLWAMSNRFV